jgi:bacteriophage N4 adsorption protein B
LAIPALAELYSLLLGALAILILFSGLDDLIPAVVCLWHAFRVQEQPDCLPESELERRIAIFVPCWNESAVIADMVRHNVAAIRYQNYDFFLGVYPNDGPTVEVAQGLAAKLKNVHIAECAHPGPTSKADCLNWIYRRMREYEQTADAYFDTVVIHDAEDLIHPAALALINRERRRYDMVQVPVLPLPTPALELTHGVYCDDFSEYQSIDMRARQLTGSFIPSNGVGTGYSRKVLDSMARARRNVVFDPESLTEDYESGIRIHALGFSQTFCSLRHSGANYLATREYFPRRFRAAVRQRTRWVMGNALQSWEKNGWRGSLATKYWLWRDRKGLLTNPLGLLTSLLFLAGVFTWIIARLEGQEWPMRLTEDWANCLCMATLGLECMRLVISHGMRPPDFWHSICFDCALPFVSRESDQCSGSLIRNRALCKCKDSPTRAHIVEDRPFVSGSGHTVVLISQSGRRACGIRASGRSSV